MSEQTLGIEKALQEGCRLHAFRSGGGLRVIRLEKGAELKGYGEHPNVEEALAYTSEDYLAGGREYYSVYGPKAIHPHYLTGSSNPSSDLDRWVLGGNTFDAWREGEAVVVDLRGYAEWKWSDEINEKLKTQAEVITESRGYTYRTTGDSTSLLKCPEGKKAHRAWMWHISKKGTGKDFNAALTEALKASEVEVQDPSD